MDIKDPSKAVTGQWWTLDLKFMEEKSWVR